MVYTSVKVMLSNVHRDEAIRIVRSLLGPTSAASGCVSCGHYIDAQNENRLCYVEEWQTEEDLKRHIRSDDYRKLLALIDLATEPPDLKFHMVSDTLGMEYLIRVRNLM